MQLLEPTAVGEIEAINGCLRHPVFRPPLAAELRVLSSRRARIGVSGERVPVAVVDAELGVRAVLQLILNSFSPFQCGGLFARGTEALADIWRVHPSIILVDVRMLDLDGVECTRRLHALFPLVPIIVLTTANTADAIWGSLCAGAIGYLIKPISVAEFYAGLMAARGGGTPICAEAQRILVTSVHRHADRLTPRLREVMVGLLSGKNAKDMAIAEHRVREGWKTASIDSVASLRLTRRRRLSSGFCAAPDLLRRLVSATWCSNRMAP